MSEVKRFAVPGRYLVADGNNPGAQDVVLANDYARLEQECERLRADKAAIDLLNQYIITAGHPVTGKTAICADSGTLRDCMEAALSAKP